MFVKFCASLHCCVAGQRFMALHRSYYIGRDLDDRTTSEGILRAQGGNKRSARSHLTHSVSHQAMVSKTFNKRSKTFKKRSKTSLLSLKNVTKTEILWGNISHIKPLVHHPSQHQAAFCQENNIYILHQQIFLCCLSFITLAAVTSRPYFKTPINKCTSLHSPPQP